MKNLKVKQGNFYNDYTNVFTSDKSLELFASPFHYCVGKNEKGDIVALNTFDPLIGLP